MQAPNGPGGYFGGGVMSFPRPPFPGPGFDNTPRSNTYNFGYRAKEPNMVPVSFPMNLSQKTNDYLVEIELALDQRQKDVEECYITNIYREIHGEEVAVAKGPKASRVIQKILRLSTISQVANFVQRISEHKEELCVHQWGNYIMKTLLEILRDFGIYKEQEVDGDNSFLILVKFVSELVGVVCSNIMEWISHRQAGHVIYALINLLSNTDVSALINQKAKKPVDSQQNNDQAKDLDVSQIKIPSPEDNVINKTFLSCIKRLSETIERHRDLPGFILETHPSLTLQAVVMALSAVNTEYYEQFSTTLMNAVSWYGEGIVANSSSLSCAFLIERIINASAPTFCNTIFNLHFEGKLEMIASNFTGNFIVQHLIEHCQSELVFEKIFTELQNIWPIIAGQGHFSVFTSLCKACARLEVCQSKFLDNLSDLLQWNKFRADANIVLLIAYFHTYTAWQCLTPEAYFNLTVTWHGSILLQNLLRFNDTTLIVTNIIRLSAQDILQLFCNKYGPFILDAFVVMPNKNWASIIHRLKDCAVEFACNKYGCVCLYKVWDVADTTQKTLIVENLLSFEHRLQYDSFAVNVLKKFAITIYKNRPNEWIEYQTCFEKKKRSANNAADDHEKKFKTN